MALEKMFILSEYKLDITGNLVIQEISSHVSKTCLRLFKAIGRIKTHYFILGTAAIFIYSLVLHKGKSKKEGWDTENKNAYYGSAHWGTSTDFS